MSDSRETIDKDFLGILIILAIAILSILVGSMYGAYCSSSTCKAAFEKGYMQERDPKSGDLLWVKIPSK